MKAINIYSPVALENWDWNNPWKQGIGGSETCHIELVERFAKRGHDVYSWAPTIESTQCVEVSPEKVEMVTWNSLQYADPKVFPENWLVFRDAEFFDKTLHPEGRYIFVAQDCDYSWTPERLAKVDKYICLCRVHAQFTLQKYPQLKGKVYISSNGVRKDYLDALKDPPERNPNKIIYSSSPDRGLLLCLQNWFRIREQCPQAELHIFYGFNNMESILQRSGGSAWFVPMKEEIQSLMNQPGIIFRGRVGQDELYREYLSSNVWWYPTDWPETSCINCMDAQACGVIPVTNKFWALEQNILHGFSFDGIPQKDPMCKVLQINEVCRLIKNPEVPWREEMMQDARDTFDWEKIVSQFERWLI